MLYQLNPIKFDSEPYTTVYPYIIWDIGQAKTWAFFTSGPKLSPTNFKFVRIIIRLFIYTIKKESSIRFFIFNEFPSLALIKILSNNRHDLTFDDIWTLNKTTIRKKKAMISTIFY